MINIKSISLSFRVEITLCPRALIKPVKAFTKPFPPPVGLFVVLKFTAIFNFIPNVVSLRI
jgi:hypothetical protein